MAKKNKNKQNTSAPNIEENIQSIQTQYENATKQLSTYEEQLQRSREELNNKNDRLNQLNVILREYRTERDRCNVDLKNQNAIKKQKSSEKVAKNREIQELATKEFVAKKLYGEESQEYKDAVTARQKAEKELEELNKDLDKINDKILQITEERNGLAKNLDVEKEVKEVDELEEEIDDLNDDITYAEKNVERLNDSIQTYKSQLGLIKEETAKSPETETSVSESEISETNTAHIPQPNSSEPETKAAEEGEDKFEQLDKIPEYVPLKNDSLTDDVAPFDVRLQRTDLFLRDYDNIRVPLSSEEITSILGDVNEYDVSGLIKRRGHAKPHSKNQWGITSNDPNLYGSLSLINPYSITRLYNALKGLEFKKENNVNYVTTTENRMIDIRDQKRFYDTKTPEGDVLSVTNPTVSNIVNLMNNDKWGRTPYTYQDFVFCKYFGRIPNNRLITLRKYASPTYDNLCWDNMGGDKNHTAGKFAPVATACTFFGGESGNSLKELFKIQTGLNWEKIEAKIWDVNGDSGESEQQVADRDAASQALTNDMNTGSQFVDSLFNTAGKLTSNFGSAARFVAMCKNPNVFNPSAAIQDKYYENLHDPNENGPYANRLKGPVNRIDEVMRRKEGLKFEHKMTLKFDFKARPIGGANTKVVMLEIISNMLELCSATAVFWGGGHRFMITPHAFPWSYPGGDAFLKALYNGRILGQNGAIATSLKGLVAAGTNDGTSQTFSLDSVMGVLKNIGGNILGALGGALGALVGTLSGAGVQSAANLVQGAADKLTSVMGGNASFQNGQSSFNNLLANQRNIHKANSIRKTILPHIEGLRAVLIGTPVGNWHVTVGNPLNPIAVIGNLICEGVEFEFGEELGPDDFPDELSCTVTMAHGMPRDLAAIESMFNRGAGRIYQAPDYIKMWGAMPTSDQETRVDAVTGNTSSRVPAKFVAVEGKARAGKYFKLSEGKELQNTGQNLQYMDENYSNIRKGQVVTYNRYSTSNRPILSRAAIAGNLHTRHYADS